MGVALPAAVRDALVATIEELRTRVDGARWIAPENLHVTIQFLGPVEDDRIGAVSEAIAAAVAGLVDVPVHLGALGAFPTLRRARVIWAGIDDPAGGVTALADAVGEALVPLGFEREAREFTPHVTLARLKAPHAVALDARVDPVRFVVDRATLFQSHLGRAGARYESLAVFPFRRAS